MKLCDVYKVLDAVAPKALSDALCAKYGYYDNSGILVDTGAEIKGVVFTLDFTQAALDRAKAAGANLIVTHHPVIYGKISDLRVNDFEPLDGKLIDAIQSGISIVSMHLNLDIVSGGVDESLMQAVGAAAGGSKGEVAYMQEVENGRYGRAYEVENTTLSALAKGLETVLCTSRVQMYGNGDKPIKKAASFCGAGGDESAVRFAVETGADVLISSDFKHHVLTLAMEKGLTVITLTHYASEQYGFEKYYQKIRTSIDLPCVYHTDEILL